MDYRTHFTEDCVRIVSVKDILQKTKLKGADYTVNPYIGCPHRCRYCYAAISAKSREPYVPWGCYLDVKQWEPIMFPRNYFSDTIVIGTATDPYNPLEPFFKRTHTFLEEMVYSDAHMTFITKSDLVINDLDLLVEAETATVAFSINILDDWLQQELEDAPSNSRRIEAMKLLYSKGVPTECYISPVLPGLTDVCEIIDNVRDFCNLIYIDPLNFRNSSPGLVSGIISCECKSLGHLYLDIYKKHDMSYWNTLSANVSRFCSQKKLPYYRKFNISQRPQCKPGFPVVVDNILAAVQRGLV